MMSRYGYDKKLSCGTICVGSSLGILIAPGLMLIIMADNSGLQVGRLFIGSIVPGLILGVLYMVYILVICYLRSELGPSLSLEERRQVSVRQVGPSDKRAIVIAL